MNSKFSDPLLAILEGISDGVVALNREAKYISINRAAAELLRRLNRDPNAIVGQSVWQVFPELRGTIVEKEIRRALENGVRIHYEYLFPTDRRWYEVQGYPSAEGVILLFRDITDRKAPTSQILT